MPMNAAYNEFMSYLKDNGFNWVLRRFLIWITNGMHGSVTIEGITPNGRITYIPRLNTELKYGSIPQSRTTSFTRFILWYVEKMKRGGWGLLYEPTESEIQQLQDAIVKWAAETLTGNQFTYEEVTGRAIVEAYRTGPDSCMKGKVGQLALYVRNPEKISLLKIYDRGVYKGRALLWTADDGSRHLDRIYPGNGTLAFVTRSYALKQGWGTKEADGVGGNTTGGVAKITLRHPGNRRLPYLDTYMNVVRADQNSLTLTNGNRSDDGCWYVPVGEVNGTSQLYGSYRTIDGDWFVLPVNLSSSGRNMRIGTYPPGLFVNNFAAVSGKTVFSAIITEEDTDKVVYCKDHEVYARKDQFVVAEDGKLYYRADVRKVRGRDAYRAKDGVKAYVMDEQTVFVTQNKSIVVYKLED